MSTIKQKANSIALAVSASFLLSACNSLPFMGDDEPEVNNLSSNTTRPSSSYNNSDNDQDLQTEIEDFKSMKPSLSRLVALESDLSFLLEEMSRFNEQNPVVYDTASAAASPRPTTTSNQAR
jgi:predicted small secreted protein